MSLILVSFFILFLILILILISHTTSVGMTLILVSFFLILIILATKWSRYNSKTTGSRVMKLSG